MKQPHYSLFVLLTSYKLVSERNCQKKLATKQSRHRQARFRRPNPFAAKRIEILGAKCDRWFAYFWLFFQNLTRRRIAFRRDIKKLKFLVAKDIPPSRYFHLCRSALRWFETFVIDVGTSYLLSIFQSKYPQIMVEIAGELSQYFLSFFYLKRPCLKEHDFFLQKLSF